MATRATAFTSDTLLVPLYAWLSDSRVGPIIIGGAGLALLPFVVPLYIAGVLAIAALPIVLGSIRSKSPAPVVNWWDEIVLITGGCHGVGLAVVEELARTKKPKKIVVFDLNSHDFGDIAERVALYKCDVSNPDMVKEVAAKVIAEVGQPTMIVNNAGIVAGGFLQDLTEKQIATVINVNLLGPMWITKAFLPGLLKAKRGHIVNVASVLGFVGTTSMTDYCASKAGLCGFHDALRQELRGTGVKASIINPGLIQTGMFSGVSYRWPFLTPALGTEEVSKAVIHALCENRNMQIRLPFFSEIGPLVRLLPTEFIDIITDFMGANNSIKALKH